MTDKPPIDKSERRRLISLAHHLKPELNIGRDGLSDAFIQSLGEAFNNKELLKIKLLDTSDETRASVRARLDALPDIELLQNIGKTFILFKAREED